MTETEQAVIAICAVFTSFLIGIALAKVFSWPSRERIALLVRGEVHHQMSEMKTIGKWAHDNYCPMCPTDRAEQDTQGNPYPQ